MNTSSEESTASAARKPFATPATPGGLSITHGGEAPSSVSMSWATANSGGGTAKYNWRLFRDGAQVAAAQTTATTAGVTGQPAGTYNFQVQTCNEGTSGDYTTCSPWSGTSGSTVVTNHVYNSSVTSTACTVNQGDFNQQPTNFDPACGSPTLSAGDQFDGQCRGQRNGKQYILIESGAANGRFILAANTNRNAFDFPDC
jgi:hypothetical protein